MKDNKAYDSGAMRNEPAVYAAYANYLARFVEEYGKEGIPVEAVTGGDFPQILVNGQYYDYSQVQKIKRDMKE